MQVFQIIQRLLETGGDQKRAIGRQATYKQLEYGSLVHALGQIRIEHRELVQVGEQHATRRVGRVEVTIHGGAKACIELLKKRKISQARVYSNVERDTVSNALRKDTEGSGAGRASDTSPCILKNKNTTARGDLFDLRQLSQRSRLR